MNRQASTRAIFLAGIVFASGAFAAGNDIKKCVAESGHVTLTDAVCPSDSQAIKIISGPAGTEPVRDTASEKPTVATERFASTRMPGRYATLIKSTPARGLSLDMTTLRAARVNMQMVDNATESLRQQRVAGLQ